MNLRPLVTSSALVVALVAAALPAAAGQRLPICHRTASETNPYVVIRPDSASWFAHLDNHVNHTPKNGRQDKFATEWSDGSFRCSQEPKTPPPTSRYARPDASIILCGDPRAFITMDNTDANIATTFRIVYWRGRDGERVVQRKTLAAGGTRTIKRWVKGGGRKVTVYARGRVLSRVSVNRSTVQRWQDADCRYFTQA